MKSNETKGPRVGIVVGKSVHKAAVTRNFWKRQARATLESSVQGNRDAILIMQSRVNELTKSQFREALVRAIHQTA